MDVIMPQLMLSLTPSTRCRHATDTEVDASEIRDLHWHGRSFPLPLFPPSPSSLLHTDTQNAEQLHYELLPQNTTTTGRPPHQGLLSHCLRQAPLLVTHPVNSLQRTSKSTGRSHHTGSQAPKTLSQGLMYL